MQRSPKFMLIKGFRDRCDEKNPSEHEPIGHGQDKQRPCGDFDPPVITVDMAASVESIINISVSAVNSPKQGTPRFSWVGGFP
jgi:hypothetical protein